MSSHRASSGLLILVVVLTGFTCGRVASELTQAKRENAELDRFIAVHLALGKFRERTGHDAPSLAALVVARDLPALPVDIQGRPLELTTSAEGEPLAVSSGLDGIVGTDDDSSLMRTPTMWQVIVSGSSHFGPLGGPYRLFP